LNKLKGEKMKKIGVIGENLEIPCAEYQIITLDQTIIQDLTFELDLCIINLITVDWDKRRKLLTQLIRTQQDIKVLAIVDQKIIAAKKQIFAGKTKKKKSDESDEWYIALFLINMAAFLVESISVEKIEKALNAEIAPYSLMMRSSVVFQLPNPLV